MGVGDILIRVVCLTQVEDGQPGALTCQALGLLMGTLFANSLQPEWLFMGNTQVFVLQVDMPISTPIRDPSCRPVRRGYSSQSLMEHVSI